MISHVPTDSTYPSRRSVVDVVELESISADVIAFTYRFCATYTVEESTGNPEKVVSGSSDRVEET